MSTPVEWLKTYLSLRDGLEEISSCDNADLYFILVVCKESNDSVIGICEVDNRSKSTSKSTSTSTSKPDVAPRPYICNLAVDKQWRKKGVGTALMNKCEEITIDSWGEECLHLRVF